MKNWLLDSTNVTFVLLAAGGGIARYLHNYTHGTKFHLSMFLANAVISGFSGLMFAYAAESAQFPPSFLYVSAGIGGFMGHSALEWLSEFIKNRIKTT